MAIAKISLHCIFNLIITNRPNLFQECINPTFIILIITNRTKFFQECKVIETRLSNFYKMSLTIMKVSYKKQKPKVIQYMKIFPIKMPCMN